MISHQKAQDIMLATMGLHRRPEAAATKADVLKTIRQMGMLQIDTISVVARSPYLVLWSRLGHYDSAWLDELLAETQIFEGWSHAACFLPIEDYPLFRRVTLDDRHPHSRNWIEENGELVAAVLAVIQEKGEAKSAHFERAKDQESGWWNWKGEKVALESLFNIGELMIARREKFQRVYALRQSVLPDWSDEKAPPLDAVYRQFVLNTVKALGISTPSWIADYYRMRKMPTLAYLKDILNENLLIPVEVEGWTEMAYLHPDNVHLLEAEIEPNLTTLLSPFDPLVWDRKRAAAMFQFDYVIECYTPAAKRVYGYFTLPILSGRRLVGRLDAKAHRKEKRFEVKSLHLEPSVSVTDELIFGVRQAIQECADWHQTPQVEFVRSDIPFL